MSETSNDIGSTHILYYTVAWHQLKDDIVALRFLDILATFDFANAPLIVDINSRLKPGDVKILQVCHVTLSVP